MMSCKVSISTSPRLHNQALRGFRHSIFRRLRVTSRILHPALEITPCQPSVRPKANADTLLVWGSPSDVEPPLIQSNNRTSTMPANVTVCETARILYRVDMFLARDEGQLEERLAAR
ncbi:hypothetical protein P171DRAFT_35180 [Karstenula rhodostoma CBS 690.94]|uniref:Uncharacterized protein n=1 Tax=Karstenula rhodostoma CBS 690.94 TaxID=1392251 RepID=A0A9P4PFQ9_9PLEO|nr:hypothetical protein P171DRAFT_35180 [Karstenula rhodostoma CBS 690.94]